MVPEQKTQGKPVTAGTSATPAVFDNYGSKRVSGAEFSQLGPGGPGMEGPRATPWWLQVEGRREEQDRQEGTRAWPGGHGP